MTINDGENPENVSSRRGITLSEMIYQLNSIFNKHRKERRHRDKESFDNLKDILHHLGDPERTGKSGTWVAKNYSLSQLIKDLQNVNTPWYKKVFNKIKGDNSDIS